MAAALKGEYYVLKRQVSFPVFTAALFTAAKMYEQHKCASTDQWKQNVACAANMCASSHPSLKMERNSDTCASTDEPRGHCAQ